MKQTRFTSLMKSLFSTAVGFGVAFLANMLILPWFGLPISHSDNLILTTIYTVISIARGYVLERVFEAMGWRMKISPFMAAVMAERQRQIDMEGWSHEHDDGHSEGDLAQAGACYAHCASLWSYTSEVKNERRPAFWPWSREWWKPVGFRRDLVKGAALIVAEGEKFDRTRKSKRKERAVTDESHSPRSAIVKQFPSDSLAHGKSRSEQGGSPV